MAGGTIRGTKGDYRHYKPCYPKAGTGITIDNSDTVFPVINADDQGGITEIQGSRHIVVDDTDPKRPKISTSGLVDKVFGTDQIIVDNTDEDNPIVKTTGLVESVTLDNQTEWGGLSLDGTSRNPVVTNKKYYSREIYTYSNNIEFTSSNSNTWFSGDKGKLLFDSSVGLSIQDDFELDSGEILIKRDGTYSLVSMILFYSTFDVVLNNINLGARLGSANQSKYPLSAYYTTNLYSTKYQSVLSTYTGVLGKNNRISQVIYIPTISGSNKIIITKNWYRSSIQINRIG